MPQKKKFSIYIFNKDFSSRISFVASLVYSQIILKFFFQAPLTCPGPPATWSEWEIRPSVKINNKTTTFWNIAILEYSCKMGFVSFLSKFLFTFLYCIVIVNYISLILASSTWFPTISGNSAPSLCDSNVSTFIHFHSRFLILPSLDSHQILSISRKYVS